MNIPLPIFFILTTLLLPLASADRLWVVGSNYVSYYDANTGLVNFSIPTEGSSFDAESCRVFVKNKSTQVLTQYSPEDGAQPLEKTGTIVSDFYGGQFLTLEDIGGSPNLIKRNALGVVEETILSRWAKDLISIQNFNERGWGLNFTAASNRRSLSRVDFEIQETQQGEVTPSTYSSPNYRFLYDRVSEMIWLGYTTKSSTGTALATLELRDTNAAVVNTFDWKTAGEFNDFCLERDGSTIVAHSVVMRSPQASQGVLDKVRLDGSQQALLKLEANFNVSAMTCNNKTVYLAEKSEFGAGTYGIYSWDRVKTMTDKVANLQGPALKVYVCKN